MTRSTDLMEHEAASPREHMPAILTSNIINT